MFANSVYFQVYVDRYNRSWVFSWAIRSCWHDQIRSDQSLSRVRLFATPSIAAHQASLYLTNSWSLPKLMSIESVIPFNHFILCRPLLLLSSIFPSIRVFSNELALYIRWPKYSASLVAQVKNVPASVGDLGLIPGSGRSQEKGMATYSSILAQRIPWTEEQLAGYGPWGHKDETRLRN